ncbi:immunity 50 family protein [Dickeya zeae]|uniref:immunity 50 family protein n=1 Tax=Dickeya zeae TaxID=204042 RepID=UPI001F2F8681|nr:immunity 50 family protein [Dickeya zeae]UJR62511.1 hypothetical protein HJ586_10085 [Dickeya zeae]
MDSSDKMSFWNELDGAALLNRVFPEPVKISYVELFDFSVNRNGPSVIVNFDLIDQLPDKAPPKWGEFNRCRCGINCGGVDELEINGISTRLNTLVMISSIDGTNHVRFLSEKFKLSLKCKHIQFMGPSVYLDC